MSRRRKGPTPPRRRARDAAATARVARVRRLTGMWASLALCAFCLAGIVVTYRQAVALRDRGERAVAEVVAVHDTRRAPYVVLRFRTRDGRDVTAEVGDYRFQPDPAVGDRQEVLYDPADPSGSVSDARVGPDFAQPWVFAATAAVCAVLARPSYAGRLP